MTMRTTAPGQDRGHGPRFGSLAGFAAYVLGVSGARAALALLFLVLGSLAEGISILLLVPILHLAGNADQGFALSLPDIAWLRRLSPGGTVGLPAVLSALVILIAAQAFFLRFKSVYMAELLSDFVNRLRMELFESIARARWRVFARTRSADLEHALNGDVERVQGAAYYLLLLLQTGALLAAYTAISLLISPAMTAFAIAVGLAILALMRPFRRRAAAYGEVMTANRQSQHRTVSDFLSGMKVAKSLNVEDVYCSRLRSTLDKMKVDNTEFTRASTTGKALFQVASALGLAVFVYVALVRQGLSLAEIVVLLLVFMRVAPRFMETQGHLQQILVNLPAFASMQALRARFAAEQEPKAPPTADGNLELRLCRELVIRDLAFAYGEGPAKAIVEGLSFTIPAGKVTALIGPSGAGKSTIADLLLGLLEPAKGEISIDGVILGPATRPLWRTQVAYVPQDVFLLHDTIGANLRLAAPEASDDALWAALCMAQAEGFVAQLDTGLETIVGERGVKLSGGERQRIALARALLGKPALLILDEATSALDWRHQALVADSIKALRGKTTILTIAHRPSMIAFADWIVAIDHGRLVESGPYDILRRNPHSHLSQLLNGEQSAA
jgi:ATP-binding cassette, subfamily C, bacterial